MGHGARRPRPGPVPPPRARHPAAPGPSRCPVTMSERRARGPLQRVQRRSRELRAQVAGLHRAGYRGCTGAGTGDVPGPVPGVSAPDRPRPLLQVEALRAESAAVAPGQREALWLR